MLRSLLISIIMVATGATYSIIGRPQRMTHTSCVKNTNNTELADKSGNEESRLNRPVSRLNQVPPPPRTALVVPGCIFHSEHLCGVPCPRTV